MPTLLILTSEPDAEIAPTKTREHRYPALVVSVKADTM